MNGFGDGKFGPDNVLTREQLAVVLTKAFNFKATSTTTFKDVDKNTGQQMLSVHYKKIKLRRAQVIISLNHKVS